MDDDPYADLGAIFPQPPGLRPWQRDYWRLSMWGMWDWIVHGALLGGIAALVWWLW
jgi:hypothetical protein